MTDNVTKLSTYNPASYPTLDGGQSTYFTTEFRKIAQALSSVSDLLQAAAFGVTKKAGLPTTTDLPKGTSGVFKDTSGGGVYLAYNDAGTIKKVALT
jgi:hypothetical protein